MPNPKIMMQFGCQAHLKISLEVPHLNPNIFSSNLDEVDNISWQEVVGTSPPSPHGVTIDYTSLIFQSLGINSYLNKILNQEGINLKENLIK